MWTQLVRYLIIIIKIIKWHIKTGKWAIIIKDEIWCWKLGKYANEIRVMHDIKIRSRFIETCFGDEEKLWHIVNRYG